jgi:hypothetical protein
MLTWTICSACACWKALPGEPNHGRCRLGPDWKATVASHGCWLGQPRLACPPSERLENEEGGGDEQS